jgi:hypothetical protein
MFIHSSLSMLTLCVVHMQPHICQVVSTTKRFSKPVLNYEHLLLTHLLPDIYSDQLNKTMFLHTSDANTSSEYT